MRDGAILSREEVLQKVSSSNEIQLQWTLVSVDIDDFELAQELPSLNTISCINQEVDGDV